MRRYSGNSALRRLCVALLALGVLAVSVTAQSVAKAKTSDVEKTLYRLEDDFARAVVRRDAKALEKLVAPRWVYSDESGVMDRAAGIKAFTSGTDTVTAATNESMRAIVYPNSAIVIGVLRLKGKSPQGPFDRKYRFTDSWALLDGRWQCVAAQDYLLPK
jgi:ketosteroid isomerase-like protein